MNNRPSWDEVWMKMAETIALRSHHPEWKVGSLIVASDNTQVLSSLTSCTCIAENT